jgi:hypothetical protein
MNLDDQAIGTGRDRGTRQRHDEVSTAGGMARVHNHR